MYNIGLSLAHTMTNRGKGKVRQAANCNFEFAANHRVLPSVVADKSGSDRRLLKLSVAFVGKFSAC